MIFNQMSLSEHMIMIVKWCVGSLADLSVLVQLSNHSHQVFKRPPPMELCPLIIPDSDIYMEYGSLAVISEIREWVFWSPLVP
jgi:hypothetical protein